MKEYKREDNRFDNEKLSEGDNIYIKNLDNYYLEKHGRSHYSKEGFSEEDYKRLQDNLVLYKEGNREATEYIISAFHNLLNMYTRFIVLQIIPKVDYYNKAKNKTCKKINPAILKFISLFGTKENENTFSYIYKTFSKYEYGDIYNTLVLALLNMANKYKIITDKNDPKYKKNGTFHNYVNKCFHFEAFRFLAKLTKDPLIFNTGYNGSKLLYFDEIDTEEENNNNNFIKEKERVLVDEKALAEIELAIDYVDRKIEVSKLPIIMKENIDLYDENSLNFNWINGAVSNPAFSVLNNYERELLIFYFVKGKSFTKIGELYGYSMETIRKQTKAAIDKLKKALDSNKKGG